MKSLFSGLPKEFYIPTSEDVVFVSDYFIDDLIGGAELTSEALIKQSNSKIFKIHSKSLNAEMIRDNQHKTWIFGNFTMVENEILQYFFKNKIKYFV
jgi:hypothetical protein